MDQSKEVSKGLDNALVLDCHGAKIVTSRRVLAKGKDYPGADHFILSRMVDPDCSEYLKPDVDGSVKIDAHPEYIRYLVNFLAAESVMIKNQLFDEYIEKFGWIMVLGWQAEFC